MRHLRPLASLTALAAIASFGFLATAKPATCQDDSLQKVVDGGVLRVAAEPGTPPMLYKEGPRYVGFDWEIANAIAKRIGVDGVVVVPGKYSELPGRLIAGKADVIISGYTADDSIAGIDWSDSYYDYGLCLIVRRGSPIRSISDLSGKVVGIFNDPAAEEEVKGMISGYQRLDKFEDGYFDLLKDGKIDAFIYDYPYAVAEMKEYGNALEIVQFNLSQSSYNVGVRRGAGTLLKMVNGAIKQLKASDEYRQIIRKYLRPRRRHQGRRRPERLQGQARRHPLRNLPRPARQHDALAGDLGSEQGPHRGPEFD
jgi:ABC-type amino acid transport substrate-binding protein